MSDRSGSGRAWSKRILGRLGSLRCWLGLKLQALVDWMAPGARVRDRRDDPAWETFSSDREELETLIFFLEGRLRDAELRLDALQSPGVRETLPLNTAERVEALVTTVAILTKSVVQLSLQVQHLYDELGMDPNDPLEDIFFSFGAGQDGEDDEGEEEDGKRSGPGEGGFGGGLGGMIN